MYYNQNKLFNRNSFIGSNFQFNSPIKLENSIDFYKKGHKIHIKKENRGKFTDYCGGKVTNACIQKGKNSPDPRIRKRATFAANARTWKHQLGGVIKAIKLVPKQMATFNKQVSRLAPQEIKTQAIKGVKDLMMGFMSPKWEQKALSRGLTKQEVEAFQNLQGRALTTKLPMSGKFGPLDVRLENLDEGIQGYSQFFNNSIHNKKFPSEHFIAISNQATHPYYSAIHEGMHHGTFNIGAPGWINPQIPLSPIEESALNKVIRNAKALSDKLEVDPTKYNKVLKKLQTNLGMSKTEAKNFLDGKIKYWKNEQESRARAGALNKYIENNPNASERELVSIDNGRYVFTDESLKNLYNKTIALGLPIVGGSLALKQLDNKN